MENLNTRYNDYYKIDVIKFIAAILIIASHCLPIFGKESLDLYYGQWFFRFAVPFFFISIGFFLNKPFNLNTEKNNINNIFKKRIIKLLNLYIISTLIYFPIIIYENNSIPQILYYLFFGYRHLWFIINSIYGILLLWLFIKIKDVHKLIIILILYLAGVFLCSYLPLFCNDSFVKINSTLQYLGTVRNGLFFAFPLITIGYLIKAYFDKIVNINSKMIISLLILFIILSFFESFIIEESFKTMYHADEFLTLDLTIMMPIVSVLLFIICIKNKPNNNSIIKINSKLFRKMSMIMYVIHVIIIIIFDFIINFISISVIPLIRCLLIIFLTIFISYIIAKINNYFKNNWKKNKIKV